MFQHIFITHISIINFYFSNFFTKNLQQNKKHSTTLYVISIISIVTLILEH